MSFNPKRCNRTPFFHPLGCRFTLVPGTPFFPTFADHFRLSRVEISCTNFLPSSLSCETSKPLKFRKSLVLLFFLFPDSWTKQKQQNKQRRQAGWDTKLSFCSSQNIRWIGMRCQAYHSFTDGPVASFVTQGPSLLFRGSSGGPGGGLRVRKWRSELYAMAGVQEEVKQDGAQRLDPLVLLRKCATTGLAGKSTGIMKFGN